MMAFSQTEQKSLTDKGTAFFCQEANAHVPSQPSNDHPEFQQHATDPLQCPVCWPEIPRGRSWRFCELFNQAIGRCWWFSMLSSNPTAETTSQRLMACCITLKTSCCLAMSPFKTETSPSFCTCKALSMLRLCTATKTKKISQTG